MQKKLLLLLGACLVIGLCRGCRGFLVNGPESRLAQVFPGAITFGAYTSFLTLASALALAHARRNGRAKWFPALVSRHGLLFMLIMGLCADLILVNYTEATREIQPSSYGLVILIDLATWMLLTFVILANQPAPGLDFRDSAVVSLVPFAFLCRETASMGHPFEWSKAGLDYRVLIVISLSWLFSNAERPTSRFNRLRQTLARWGLLGGLLYWVLLVLWNVTTELMGVRITETLTLKLVIAITAAVLAIPGLWVTPLRHHFAGRCE